MRPPVLSQQGIRKNEMGGHKERANSSDSTCAFFAALLARVQSPTCAASRASATKLRTLEARSDCVALSVRPRDAAIFRSAILKLRLVCCCAAAVSSAVNCGTICGGSGRDAALGPDATLGTRGRGGPLGTAVNGEGGDGTSSVASIRDSSAAICEDATALGSTGRADFALAHGNDFALGLFWPAHPLRIDTATHNPSTDKRREA